MQGVGFNMSLYIETSESMQFALFFQKQFSSSEYRRKYFRFFLSFAFAFHPSDRSAWRKKNKKMKLLRSIAG